MITDNADFSPNSSHFFKNEEMKREMKEQQQDHKENFAEQGSIYVNVFTR